MIQTIYSDELYHHGVKGQKWGVRRWQNPDGTLTEAGKRHYGLNNLDSSDRSMLKGKSQKQIQKMANREAINFSNKRTVFNTSSEKAAKAMVEKYLNEKYGSEVASKAMAQDKKVMKGRAVIGAIGSVMGAYFIADGVVQIATGTGLSERAVTTAKGAIRYNRENPKFKSNGHKFRYNSNTNSFTGTYRDLGPVRESTALAIRPRAEIYRR